jgi:hypothetical protein
LEEMKFSQYHTKSLKAVTYFGQGLGALDVGNWREARQFFEKAVEEDPSFTLAVLYRDASPSAAAPSMEALSTMTDTEVSEQTDGFVSSSMALQAEILDSPNDPSEILGAEDATGPGSVSFSW